MNSTTTTKPATPAKDTFSRIAAEHDVSEILMTALDVVKAAAQQRDPSITDWFLQTSLDDEADVAFALTGLRKPRHLSEDRLVAAIAALHTGMVAFDRKAPDDDEGRDACAAETYEPPLEALLVWDKPATSVAGAIAALRVVDQVEWLPGGLKLALAMNKAALRYLEARAI